MFYEMVPKLPNSASLVRRIEEGCVKVVFQNPLMTTIPVSLSQNQIRLLRDNYIVDVTVNGQSLLNVSYIK